VGDEREWQTRKTRIDPRLDAVGWRRSSGPAAYRSEEGNSSSARREVAGRHQCGGRRM